MNRLFLFLFGALTFAAHAQVPDYVPTEGLVAWLSLDSAETSLTSFVATQGNYISVTDRFGELSAARFTDQAIVMESENDSTPSGSFTFSFWAYHEGQEQLSTAIHPIWGQTFGNASGHAGCGIWMHGTQLKVVEHSANYVRTAVNVVENFIGWHFITVVYQSNEMQVYRDGLLVAANTDNGRLIHAPLGRDEYSNYVNFGIGMGFGPSGSTSTANVFQGVLDDFAVWNRVLSQEEISGMIEAEMGCIDPNACNFDEEAIFDDGSCIPCDSGYIFCGTGTVWDNVQQTCIALTDEWTGNPCGPGTFWDELLSLCLPIESCASDIDGDGVSGVSDLMLLLSTFGTDCPEAGDPETAEFTCGDPVSYQGYDYATVQIGEQCWFAENLRAEQYLNGDSIPGNLNDDAWTNATGGAQAILNENEEKLELHGRLYNFYAVLDERSLCPAGWHVPADEEWITLGEGLGGIEVAGVAMKNSGSDTPPWDGTNSSHWNGTPGGKREMAGWYDGSAGYWWTSTPYGCGGWHRNLHPNLDALTLSSYCHAVGFSVRCLKDQ